MLDKKQVLAELKSRSIHDRPFKLGRALFDLQVIDTWIEIDEELFYEMLEDVPPVRCGWYNNKAQFFMPCEASGTVDGWPFHGTFARVGCPREEPRYFYKEEFLHKWSPSNFHVQIVAQFGII